MKRKFLSVLVSAVVLCTCIFALTACGENEPSHTHDFTTLKFDSETHWFECECEEKNNIATHNIKNGKCVCGYIEPHSHEYTTLKNNETEHWYECVCGDKSGIEAHNGGTATCTELAVCSVCSKSYGELVEHNYATLKNNETQHWYECACGDKNSIENHKGGTATCTEKAKCEVCATEYGEANGHNYSSEITEPTCEEQGYTTYTCHCSDSYVADYVNALGHTTVIDKAVAPTCTETGLTEGKHCSTCNEVLVSQLEIPSLGHSYQQTIITDDCSAPYGIVEYNCDNCGDSYSGKGSKITLSFSADGYGQGVNSSIGAYTYYSYKVSQSGGYGKVLIKYELYSNSSLSNLVETWDFSADKKVKIYLTGNIDVSNYVFKITAKDEIGNKSVYCFRLGDSAELSKTISKFNEHTPSDWIISKEPTCTEKGSKYTECSICKTKIETQEIAMLPHVEGDWITTLEPTCLEEGRKYQECSVCHSELDHASIDALGHEYTGKIDETTTCEKAVGTATCTRCNAIKTIIVEHITINVELLNESFNQLQPDDYGYYEKLFSINTNGGYGTILYKYELFSSTTATKPQKTVDFTEDNTIKLSFTGCGSALANYYYRVTVKDEVGNVSIYTFDISLDSITKIKVGTNAEHTPGNWIVDLEPTCTEIGSKYQECSVCHIALDRGTVDATGHTDGDWIIDLEPTCTEAGSKHKECIVCKEQLVTDNISAFGHTEGEWIIDLEPTCEADGSKHKTCTVCNQFLFAEIIYSHNFEDGFCKDCGCEFYNYGLQFVLSDDEISYVVAKYIGNDTAVVIPNLYKSKPVIKIASGVFSGCTGLTSITIPDNVTSIGDSAFSGCSSLTSITIPDSVTTIGSNAFYGCSSLSNIYITDIAAWCNVLGLNNLMCYGSSQKCLYLNDVLVKNLVIPDGITNIEAYTFRNCSSLTSVLIPDSVTSIGSSAFGGCSSLENMVIPFVGHSKAATSSSSSTLFGYIFGTSYYAGSSATSQYYISSSLSTLIATYYIPASLKKVTITGGNILNGAFYNCSNLSSVVVGDGVSLIESKAFYNCSGLTEMTLPFVGESKSAKNKAAVFGHIFGYTTTPTSGTTYQYFVNQINAYSCYYYIPNSIKKITITGRSIPEGAFLNCNNLTSIEIGDSLSYIGLDAFDGCSNLSNVYITDILAWCNISGVDNLMRYGANQKSLYLKNALLEKLVIPDGVTSISSYAFSGCSGLTSIEIPDSVTSIGSSAFWGCDSLTSVVIPNSVTSIGDRAFYNCHRLVEVINNSPSITVEKGSSGNGYLGYYALLVSNRDSSYVSKLSTDSNSYVMYSDGSDKILVGYVGSQTELTIPSDITKIYKYAFYGCSSLTSVTIPDSVTSIGDSAFKGCSNLKSITFKDTITWYRTTNRTNWNNKTGGTQTTVTSSSTNATYFTSTYYDYYWYKK